MNKPRLHFHSDCPFFAGCENMIANFLNDQDLAKKYDISFSYRDSAAYRKGLSERVREGINAYPLPLLDFYSIHQIPERIGNRLLRAVIAILVKAAAYPFKLYVILHNTHILSRLFRNKGIEILHINNGGYPGAYSCLSAVMAAKNNRIRNIVYVVNNIAVGYRGLPRKMDYFYDRLAAKTVSRFVTGSKNSARYLQKVLRLPDEKITSIHNGIRLRKVTETRKDVLKRLGIDKAGKRLLIGIVAILEERKGHIHLIDAMELLARQNFQPMPLLLIEGHGPKEKDLRSAVAKKGLEKFVRFIGDEKNVFNFLNTIDVFVLPSIGQEDFPNVTLEAMGLGKAVIATDIAGLPEQIDSGLNGLLVKPANAGEIAGAIARLIRDTKLRKKMTTAGQARFRKNFTPETAVRKYMKLYTEIPVGVRKS